MNSEVETYFQQFISAGIYLQNPKILSHANRFMNPVPVMLVIENLLIADFVAGSGDVSIPEMIVLGDTAVAPSLRWGDSVKGYIHPYWA
jgi:hypothetical protein